jgi:hypothetical protein
VSKENPVGPVAAEAAAPAKWWCNFCDLRTNDQKEYLAHSCVEVLERQGKKLTAGGKNACG